MGLLGRNSDAPVMLLLTPCRAVHTFFMRRSIDLIFLDRAGNVLGVTSNLKPWRICWNFRAASVLECEPGFVWNTGLLSGDSLALSPLRRSLLGMSPR